MKSQIVEVIDSPEPLAIILRFEDPVHLDYYIRGTYEEGLEEKSDAQMQDFLKTFEECLGIASERLGKPNYMERDYSGSAPMWAPMGVYAEWLLSDDRMVCLFMGGDGNPEDPLMLIVGSTSPSAKDSADDPWHGHWRECAQESESEPTGTGQPATRPVDKPEGSEKPQPEAEGRCP